MKDCARGIVLLKLTTDRHEASRGLSATAEFLVVTVVVVVNPLIATLKQQSNGPSYSNTVIGTLGGLLHLVQRGGAWADRGSAQSPPRYNRLPVDGQCTNFVLFDAALLPLASKGLTNSDGSGYHGTFDCRR